TGALRSFGLDVILPDGVEVDGMERSEATSDWMGLDQGNAPGVLRMGGYNLTGVPLSTGEWVTLGYVEVHAGAEAAEVLTFSLLDLSQELAGAQYVEAGIQVFGDVTELPSAFSLSEPRPNPSRGAVSVDFLVPAGPGRQVDIAVYNVHGQMVRQLENGAHSAGQYTVDWDGRDESGSRVAPGAYFFSMKAETFQATRKVVQMR
ncbi:T9SS type A sorting domain-containing protein, partial [bacterium]|nr:T9SS type A sorting domain-containing protein [bacterium]